MCDPTRLIRCYADSPSLWYWGFSIAMVDYGWLMAHNGWLMVDYQIGDYGWLPEARFHNHQSEMVANDGWGNGVFWYCRLWMINGWLPEATKKKSLQTSCPLVNVYTLPWKIRPFFMAKTTINLWPCSDHPMDTLRENHGKSTTLFANFHPVAPESMEDSTSDHPELGSNMTGPWLTWWAQKKETLRWADKQLVHLVNGLFHWDSLWFITPVVAGVWFC